MLGFWRVLGPLQAVLMTFSMEFSTKKCAGGWREIAFGRMLERELHLGSLLGMLLHGEERGRERERAIAEGFCNAAMSSSSSSMNEVQLSCVARSNAFLDHKSSSSSNSSTTTWRRRGRSTRTSFWLRRVCMHP
jgi:hypothetical protein